jgi:hypothetical protein
MNWAGWIWFATLAVLAAIHIAGFPFLSHSSAIRLAFFWFLGLIALAVTEAIVVETRRERYRRALRESLCVVCGYDLRASAARCPECGAEQPPGHPTAL